MILKLKVTGPHSKIPDSGGECAADAAVQGQIVEPRHSQSPSSLAKFPAPLPPLPESRGKSPHFPICLDMRQKTFTSSSGRRVETMTRYDRQFSSHILL